MLLQCHGYRNIQNGGMGYSAKPVYIGCDRFMFEFNTSSDDKRFLGELLDTISFNCMKADAIDSAYIHGLMREFTG